MDTADQELMRAAIFAARQGSVAVRPNPRVGAAVRARDGRIVADFHKEAGKNHAERELLEKCRREGLDVCGATMAVTLEPCCHHGKTPPCTDALIEAGIARVLVGCRDPFAQINGQGIAALRAAGIEVLEGVMESDCKAVDLPWLVAQRQGHAYTRLKMAVSLDGLWSAANGESQWITSASARERGHHLRAQSGALITGRGTWEKDNPRFTARDSAGKNFPRQPRVYVLSQKAAPDLSQSHLAAHPGGAEGRQSHDLRAVLQECLSQGLTEALIEAGPTLSAAFLEAGLVNEVHLFQAPRFLGGGGRQLPALRGGQLPGLELGLIWREELLDGDLYQVFRPLR